MILLLKYVTRKYHAAVQAMVQNLGERFSLAAFSIVLEIGDITFDVLSAVDFVQQASQPGSPVQHCITWYVLFTVMAVLGGIAAVLMSIGTLTDVSRRGLRVVKTTVERNNNQLQTLQRVSKVAEVMMLDPGEYEAELLNIKHKIKLALVDIIIFLVDLVPLTTLKIILIFVYNFVTEKLLISTMSSLFIGGLKLSSLSQLKTLLKHRKAVVQNVALKEGANRQPSLDVPQMLSDMKWSTEEMQRRFAIFTGGGVQVAANVNQENPNNRDEVKSLKKKVSKQSACARSRDYEPPHKKATRPSPFFVTTIHGSSEGSQLVTTIHGSCEESQPVTTIGSSEGPQP